MAQLRPVLLRAEISLTFEAPRRSVTSSLKSWRRNASRDRSNGTPRQGWIRYRARFADVVQLAQHAGRVHIPDPRGVFARVAAELRLGGSSQGRS
ncbi:hypothetical protein MTX26_28790 [Bradyrhizobium sp. ISRA443]|uniref:hypothetical protein n=1 Tax=unclassified Bradyrhizobium TaxID=2631580 RepID=UPI0024783AB8|nr:MULTISPECIES: hypothetical protein [unclassified Bradyrhizobium]WGR93646.1 hypothetical protein MTX20_03665 [Bradyrhizobium sp. ISRA435]WGR98220.1 hypothetical protein MTX23_28780 [Bradyrhizobium sp. ISRA436]WGS05109.1 hypothetical protein MTX18_28795 [Bradyrhizobium sp. ISRA437]WGS11994.1 hypothetical protein MTX26_28790 [Bradyrhizobium sp. ISRA443]